MEWLRESFEPERKTPVNPVKQALAMSQSLEIPEIRSKAVLGLQIDQLLFGLLQLLVAACNRFLQLPVFPSLLRETCYLIGHRDPHGPHHRPESEQ